MNLYFTALNRLLTLVSTGKAAKDAASDASDWLFSGKSQQLANERQDMLLRAFASIPDLAGEDGKTTAKYGELEAALMRQGRELPITHEQIAALFKAAFQLGYSSPEELEAFASTAGKASVAFGASPEAMSAAMGGYSKALELDLAQSKAMFDLVSLYNSTGAASGEVTAAIIGQLKNFEQTGPEAAKTATALAATLGKQGAAPEDAAKSINSIFSVLGEGNNATEAQKAAFAELGLDPVELAEKMKTSSSAAVLELLKSIAALAPERKKSVARALLGEQGAEGVYALLKKPGGMAQLRQNMDTAASGTEYSGKLEQSFKSASARYGYKKVLEQNEQSKKFVDAENTARRLDEKREEELKTLRMALDSGEVKADSLNKLDSPGSSGSAIERHNNPTSERREAYEQKPSVADTAQAVNPPFKAAAGKSEEGETTSGPSLRRAVTPPGDAAANSGKTAVTPPGNADANSGKTNERPGKSGVNNGDADTKKPSILLDEAKLPSSEAVTPPFPTIEDKKRSQEGEARKQNSAAPAGQSGPVAPAGAGGTITERQAAAAANANAPGTERHTDSTTASREAYEQKPSVADTAQAVNPPFKAAAGKSEEGETTSGPSLRRAVTPPGDADVNSGKTAVTPPGNADANSGKTNERPGKSGANNNDADVKKPSILRNKAKIPSSEAVTPPFPTIEDKKRSQEGEARKQNSAAPAGQNGPIAPAGAGGTITERQAAAAANANDPGTERYTDSTTERREAYGQKPSVADTAQAVTPPFKAAAGKSEEGETTSGPSLRRAVTPPGDTDVNSGKTAVTPPSNANANSGKTNERPGKSGVNNGDADTKKPSILLNEAKLPSSEAVAPPFPTIEDKKRSQEGEAPKQNSAAPAGQSGPIAPAGAGGTITERQAAAAANANAPGTERHTDSTRESREAHRQRASELLKPSHSATERRNDSERHSATERRNTGTERHSDTERQSTTERHTDSTSERREGYGQKPSVADTAQAVNPPFKATATAATAPFPTIEDKKRGQEGEAQKQNYAAPAGQSGPVASAGAGGTITERQAAAAANANANGPVTPAVSSDSETERHTDSTTASRKISALFQSSHSTEARRTDTERHIAAERHSVNTGQKPSVADTAQAVNPPFKAVVAKSEEGATTRSLSPEGSLAARNGQGGIASGAGGIASGAGGIASGAGGIASGAGGMASGAGGIASGAGGMASGAGGMPGAGVSATFNFTLNGIPEGDLARQIINVLDARKADIESLVSEIVNNQMRLAYGE